MTAVALLVGSARSRNTPAEELVRIAELIGGPHAIVAVRTVGERGITYVNGLPLTQWPQFALADPGATPADLGAELAFIFTLQAATGEQTVAVVLLTGRRVSARLVVALEGVEGVHLVTRHNRPVVVEPKLLRRVREKAAAATPRPAAEGVTELRVTSPPPPPPPVPPPPPPPPPPVPPPPRAPRPVPPPPRAPRPVPPPPRAPRPVPPAQRPGLPQPARVGAVRAQPAVQPSARPGPFVPRQVLWAYARVAGLTTVLALLTYAALVAISGAVSVGFVESRLESGAVGSNLPVLRAQVQFCFVNAWSAALVLAIAVTVVLKQLVRSRLVAAAVGTGGLSTLLMNLTPSATPWDSLMSQPAAAAAQVLPLDRLAESPQLYRWLVAVLVLSAMTMLLLAGMIRRWLR